MGQTSLLRRIKAYLIAGPSRKTPSLFPGRGPRRQVFVCGVEDVALHGDPRQLGSQTTVLHLLGADNSLATDRGQRSYALRLDPVAQGLLDDAQRAGRRGQTLPRLNQPYGLLLELLCVLLPRRLRHYPYHFALQQPAKSDVLRRQGQLFGLLVFFLVLKLLVFLGGRHWFRLGWFCLGRFRRS